MSPNDDLWQRLQAFELDVEGASLPFSARLARDNGWSLEFAARVALEYKKFLYLACTAGHMVTPSDEVDQAWHLHLVYTRSYWDELCAKVLRQPLHHGPTQGGKGEGRKFENWYERTLDSYRAAFGEEPPSDIWPPSHIRFGEALYFRRVNLKRHFLLPRPRCPKASPEVSWKVAPAALLLALAGCSTSSSLNPFNPFDWYGSEFLTLFGMLCLAVMGFSFWIRSQVATPDDNHFPTALPDAYALTRLADGGTLPIDAALAALEQQGYISIDSKAQITRASTHGAPSHPFEREVWNAVTGRVKLEAVRYRLKGAMGRFDAELQRLGLIASNEARSYARNWPLGLSLLLVGFGCTKIVVGLNRDRPVGFLVVSCLVLLTFALVLCFAYPVRSSQRGKRYLKKLRLDYKHQKPTGSASFFGAAMGMEVPLMMALWGYAPLPSNLRSVFRPSASDSGSGGSDGGSGCGGSGCGGCGGGGD